jgi:hypothetical protein
MSKGSFFPEREGLGSRIGAQILRPTAGFKRFTTSTSLTLTMATGQLDVQPYTSSDRETLFFASIRPGNVGNTDIYMTTRTKLSDK